MKKVATPILVAMSLSFVAIPASSQVIPPAPGKETYSREQVERAQQALRDKGQDPGPIDGIIGPRTKAAVKNFQRGEGLTKLGVEITPGDVPRPGEVPRERRPQATPPEAPQEKRPEATPEVPSVKEPEKQRP